MTTIMQKRTYSYNEIKEIFMNNQDYSDLCKTEPKFMDSDELLDIYELKSKQEPKPEEKTE